MRPLNVGVSLQCLAGCSRRSWGFRRLVAGVSENRIWLTRWATSEEGSSSPPAPPGPPTRRSRVLLPQLLQCIPAVNTPIAAISKGLPAEALDELEEFDIGLKDFLQSKPDLFAISHIGNAVVVRRVDLKPSSPAATPLSPPKAPSVKRMEIFDPPVAAYCNSFQHPLPILTNGKSGLPFPAALPFTGPSKLENAEELYQKNPRLFEGLAPVPISLKDLVEIRSGNGDHPKSQVYQSVLEDLASLGDAVEVFLDDSCEVKETGTGSASTSTPSSIPGWARHTATSSGTATNEVDASRLYVRLHPSLRPSTVIHSGALGTKIRDKSATYAECFVLARCLSVKESKSAAEVRATNRGFEMAGGAVGSSPFMSHSWLQIFLSYPQYFEVELQCEPSCLAELPGGDAETKRSIQLQCVKDYKVRFLLDVQWSREDDGPEMIASLQERLDAAHEEYRTMKREKKRYLNSDRCNQLTIVKHLQREISLRAAPSPFANHFVSLYYIHDLLPSDTFMQHREVKESEWKDRICASCTTNCDPSSLKLLRSYPALFTVFQQSPPYWAVQRASLPKPPEPRYDDMSEQDIVQSIVSANLLIPPKKSIQYRTDVNVLVTYLPVNLRSLVKQRYGGIAALCARHPDLFEKHPRGGYSLKKELVEE